VPQDPNRSLPTTNHDCNRAILINAHVPNTNPTNNPKPIIGLLGGIGSGKSFVARQFASLGCAVIDADKLAHQALQDPSVIQEIRIKFGPTAIDPTGHVDPAALAKTVFINPDKLAQLENLIHPLVNRARLQLHAKLLADPNVLAIVEDTPLLVEKQLHTHCNTLVFIHAPHNRRLQRILDTRKWNPRDLAQREKLQTPLDTKSQMADYVIDNDADADHCLSQVRSVFNQILQSQH